MDHEAGGVDGRDGQLDVLDRDFERFRPLPCDELDVVEPDPLVIAFVFHHLCLLDITWRDLALEEQADGDVRVHHDVVDLVSVAGEYVQVDDTHDSRTRRSRLGLNEHAAERYHRHDPRIPAVTHKALLAKDGNCLAIELQNDFIDVACSHDTLLLHPIWV